MAKKTNQENILEYEKRLTKLETNFEYQSQIIENINNNLSKMSDEFTNSIKNIDIKFDEIKESIIANKWISKIITGFITIVLTVLITTIVSSYIKKDNGSLEKKEYTYNHNYEKNKNNK